MNVRRLVSAALLLCCILFMFSPVLAAGPFGPPDNNDDQGVYVGREQQGVPLGERVDQGEGASDQPAYSQRFEQKDERRIGVNDLGRDEQIGKLKKSKDMPVVDTARKKAKIVLKAEAGDGLIHLSWRVADHRPKQGETSFKFTLFYGIESGRYGKKLELGDGLEHVLRGVKNNQVYFVKVQATAKVQEEGDDEETKWVDLTVFSNELKVTPLAADEQGSPLEQSFARKTVTLQDKLETDTFRRELKQFGYDFFSNSLANSSPVDNVPVGSDYIIAPGDSLRIDLWGGVQGRFDLTVDRNGEISIPRIGTVKVWGLNYGQAKEVINKAISRVYKGYELNVTLGRLRSIQVFVVGEVESPGTYTVNSLATVINALSVAGGPSKNGSLRTIRLMRGGKQVQEIDLYDMFLSGDRSKDIRLENGDSVFVPVIGPVAAVAGEVKRPAIYELRSDTTLTQLLQMSGGVTAAGNSARVQVERFEGNRNRVVQDFVPKESAPDLRFDAVKMQDRDMVKVFPVSKVLRQVVTLSGNVTNPGEYQFRQKMRVTDVIPSFEALLPDSYLEAAEIIRIAKPDFHKETVSFNLQKALSGDERENLVLQEQDAIKVFSRRDMEEKPIVSINGFVVNPGSYDYFPHMTVRDLVTAAGSPKRNAFLDNAEMTRIEVANGKAKATRLDIDLRKALAGDPLQNLELQPDDVLIVRGIVEWLESTDRFVTLKGEVRFPGTYSITKGERLSSVIRRAGGFTERAYLNGSKFTRKSVQKDQQKRMDEIVQREEQEIMKRQGEVAAVASSREELEATKSALEGLQKSLEKLKTVKAEGRVVIRLAKLEEFERGPFDMELQGGDALEIPQTPNVVNILGQVYNQTTLIHQPGESVGFYLKRSGGPTRSAETDEMYVVRADGTVFSRQQSSFGIRWDEASRSWTFGSFMSVPLEPGDTLVVPQKIERVAWLREIKDITQIIANAAVTAGTIILGLR